MRKSSRPNFVLLNILISSIILLLPSSIWANIPKFALSEYEAQYKVKIRGISVGKGITQLRQLNNGHYRLSSKTQPAIPLLPYHYIESSDFDFIDAKVIPINYIYDHKEGSRTKQGRVLFNWKDKQITAKGNKHSYEEKLTKGIQSKLSQAIMLQKDLSLGKTEIKYLVAEDDEVKEYIYKVVGKEQIKTTLGILDTIKIEYDEPHKKRTTLSWHAVNYNYVPVKLIHIRKGKVIGGGEIFKLDSLS